MEYGKGVLKDAGVLDYQLDAWYLMEYACKICKSEYYLHAKEEMEGAAFQEYTLLLKKRGERVPLQYITGVQEFMGLPFFVNDQVLIPRQDTEILVEEAMRELHDGMSILDMCTGSGCILLSLLHYSNDCKGMGTDISPGALEIAGRNAAALSLEADLRMGDLFAALEPGMKFDMLVSNPPYIPSGVIPTLMEEVRDHEPVCALDGQADGLHFYRRISREAVSYLHRGAWVFLEIGFDQGPAVSRIFREAGYREIEIFKDFSGHDRVVKCMA